MNVRLLAIMLICHCFVNGMQPQQIHHQKIQSHRTQSHYGALSATYLAADSAYQRSDFTSAMNLFAHGAIHGDHACFDRLSQLLPPPVVSQGDGYLGTPFILQHQFQQLTFDEWYKDRLFWSQFMIIKPPVVIQVPVYCQPNTQMQQFQPPSEQVADAELHVLDPIENRPVSPTPISHTPVLLPEQLQELNSKAVENFVAKDPDERKTKKVQSLDPEIPLPAIHIAQDLLELAFQKNDSRIWDALKRVPAQELLDGLSHEVAKNSIKLIKEENTETAFQLSKFLFQKAEESKKQSRISSTFKEHAQDLLDYCFTKKYAPARIWFLKTCKDQSAVLKMCSQILNENEFKDALRAAAEEKLLELARSNKEAFLFYAQHHRDCGDWEDISAHAIRAGYFIQEKKLSSLSDVEKYRKTSLELKNKDDEASISIKESAIVFLESQAKQGQIDAILALLEIDQEEIPLEHFDLFFQFSSHLQKNHIAWLISSGCFNRMKALIDDAQEVELNFSFAQFLINFASQLNKQNKQKKVIDIAPYLRSGIEKGTIEQGIEILTYCFGVEGLEKLCPGLLEFFYDEIDKQNKKTEIGFSRSEMRKFNHLSMQTMLRLAQNGSPQAALVGYKIYKNLVLFQPHVQKVNQFSKDITNYLSLIGENKWLIDQIDRYILGNDHLALADKLLDQAAQAGIAQALEEKACVCMERYDQPYEQAIICLMQLWAQEKKTGQNFDAQRKIEEFIYGIINIKDDKNFDLTTDAMYAVLHSIPALMKNPDLAILAFRLADASYIAKKLNKQDVIYPNEKVLIDIFEQFCSQNVEWVHVMLGLFYLHHAQLLDDSQQQLNFYKKGILHVKRAPKKYLNGNPITDLIQQASKKALECQDFQAFYSFCWFACQLGDPGAYYTWGIDCLKGKVQPQKYKSTLEEAIEYLGLSAQAGYEQSARELIQVINRGIRYAHDGGILLLPSIRARAVELLSQAAMNNDAIKKLFEEFIEKNQREPENQLDRAVWHLVNARYEQALHLFGAERAQLNCCANAYLGIMYQYGLGVEQSDQKAFECYESILTLPREWAESNETTKRVASLALLGNRSLAQSGFIPAENSMLEIFLDTYKKTRNEEDCHRLCGKIQTLEEKTCGTWNQGRQGESIFKELIEFVQEETHLPLYMQVAALLASRLTNKTSISPAYLESVFKILEEKFHYLVRERKGKAVSLNPEHVRNLDYFLQKLSAYTHQNSQRILGVSHVLFALNGHSCCKVDHGIQILKRLSDHNDLHSKSWLGQIYVSKILAPNFVNQGRKLLKACAQQGHQDSLIVLARALCESKNMQELKEAEGYLIRLSKSMPCALVNLAQLYYEHPELIKNNYAHIKQILDDVEKNHPEFMAIAQLYQLALIFSGKVKGSDSANALDQLKDLLLSLTSVAKYKTEFFEATERIAFEKILTEHALCLEKYVQRNRCSQEEEKLILDLSIDAFSLLAWYQILYGQMLDKVRQELYYKNAESILKEKCKHHLPGICLLGQFYLNREFANKDQKDLSILIQSLKALELIKKSPETYSDETFQSFLMQAKRYFLSAGRPDYIAKIETAQKEIIPQEASALSEGK